MVGSRQKTRCRGAVITACLVLASLGSLFASLDHPDDVAAELERARHDFHLQRYREARELLLSILSVEPANREAHVLLAQIDVRHRRFRQARRHYELVLKNRPADFEARFGCAQLDYYQGRLGLAFDEANSLVKEQPANFDVLLLLASIERARGHKHTALAWLDRADRVSPANPEAQQLRERINAEAPLKLHTVSSYAREIGLGNPHSATAAEDLRAAAFSTTWSFTLLPRSDSFLVLGYFPINSPFGAIGGAAAPSAFMYRQSTRAAPWLTVRGGLGLTRLGPGAPLDLVSVHTLNLDGTQTTALERLDWQAPQIPVNAPSPLPAGARTSPVAYAGFSLFQEQRVSLDFSLSRSALTYTPATIKLGVVETREECGLNWRPVAGTDLHLAYFNSNLGTQPYFHVTLNTIRNGQSSEELVIGTNTHADRDHARGGSIVLNYQVIQRRRLSLGAGYSGLAYGFRSHKRGIFLGYFNPGVYQRHLATAQVHLKLWGPLTYQFEGGVGIQQVERRQALTRAVILSPALSLRKSSRLSFTIGYTYYNSAQTLGTVRGNAVRLETDWKF